VTVSMPTLPNLFIVGAPKSGTTALATFLGEHPDVFMAHRELHFFGSDLDFRRRTGEDTYLGWYRAHADRRYRGDKSVYYLCSGVAAREIHDRCPDSRVLILLRNPVDQMHSSHSELLFQGDEDIRDFEAALSAEPARCRGERIPAGCRKPFALRYRAIAHYADQVERYLDVFGPGRVRTIVYEEFAEDVAASYRSVLEFLDLDAGIRPDFRVVTSNKQVRSTWLQGALHGASPLARGAGRLVVPGRRARAAVVRRVQRLNTAERPRPEMAPALRRALTDEFAGEVERLERLLGRDLRRWSSP